jgi:hypothetical protein
MFSCRLLLGKSTVAYDIRPFGNVNVKNRFKSISMYVKIIIEECL